MQLCAQTKPRRDVPPPCRARRRACATELTRLRVEVRDWTDALERRGACAACAARAMTMTYSSTWTQNGDGWWDWQPTSSSSAPNAEHPTSASAMERLSSSAVVETGKPGRGERGGGSRASVLKWIARQGGLALPERLPVGEGHIRPPDRTPQGQRRHVVEKIIMVTRARSADETRRLIALMQQESNTGWTWGGPLTNQKQTPTCHRTGRRVSWRTH